MTEEPKSVKEAMAWVPAFIAIVMTLTKCILLIVPYMAATYLNNEQAGIMASISTDEGFNMVWIAAVTFWVGKESFKK